MKFEGKCCFSLKVVSAFCSKTLEKQIYKEEKIILAYDSKGFKPCPAFEATAKRQSFVTEPQGLRVVQHGS